MNVLTTHAGNETETIRFGFGEFSLGMVLVATSSRGIAAILLGDDRPKLRNELIGAFPQALVAPDETGLEQSIAKVIAFLEAPHAGLDLPLDLRGTALQRAVWQALREIPSGQTVSYGEIAKALPLPATAQDVGVACAANLLAVAVPCHRVVKADGSISGYRWGINRKRKLINREAVA